MTTAYTCVHLVGVRLRGLGSPEAHAYIEGGPDSPLTAMLAPSLRPSCERALQGPAIREAILNAYFRAEDPQDLLERLEEHVRERIRIIESGGSHCAYLILEGRAEQVIPESARIIERLGVRVGLELIDKDGVRTGMTDFLAHIVAAILLANDGDPEIEVLLDEVYLEDAAGRLVHSISPRVGGASLILTRGLTPERIVDFSANARAVAASAALESASRILVSAVHHGTDPAVAFLLAFTSVEVLAGKASTRARAKEDNAARARFKRMLHESSTVPPADIDAEADQFASLKKIRDGLGHHGGVAAAAAASRTAIEFALKHLRLIRGVRFTPPATAAPAAAPAGESFSREASS